MSDLIDRQMLKADLLCGDNAEHDYCFPCKEILERIDNQPAAQQKKKNRNGRDSYGRLLVNGWHLEVSRAEINIDSDDFPIVLSVDIHGYDYHGSRFSQTLMPSAETHDKCTEMHACDLIDRQALMKEFSDFVRASNNSNFARTPTWNDAVSLVGSMPSAQPEWNNHTVACLLAELFDDTCACNYNGIDEWLPGKCELLDSCLNPVGVACWEQYLKHRAERRTDGDGRD